MHECVCVCVCVCVWLFVSLFGCLFVCLFICLCVVRGVWIVKYVLARACACACTCACVLCVCMCLPCTCFRFYTRVCFVVVGLRCGICLLVHGRSFAASVMGVQ